MNKRLLLADDHPIVLQGLRGIVARAAGLQVVGEARDGAEAERLARCVAADLLVLDIAMPLRSGIQTLKSLRRDGIALPVLFYSMVPAPQYAAYVRRAGGQGLVGKESDEHTVLAAMRCVLDGGTTFPTRAAAPRRTAGALALSARESQVLQGLVEGLSLVAIAAGLGIGVPSVTTYRRRLLDKLGVTSNAELIRRMKP